MSRNSSAVRGFGKSLLEVGCRNLPISGESRNRRFRDGGGDMRAWKEIVNLSFTTQNCNLLRKCPASSCCVLAADSTKPGPPTRSRNDSEHARNEGCSIGWDCLFSPCQNGFCRYVWPAPAKCRLCVAFQAGYPRRLACVRRI